HPPLAAGLSAEHLRCQPGRSCAGHYPGRGRGHDASSGARGRHLLRRVVRWCGGGHAQAGRGSGERRDGGDHLRPRRPLPVLRPVQPDVMSRHTSLRFQPAGGERKTQVPVGKKQKLSIERLANDGRGIAFVEGRSWFVAGALPGEEVEARVLAARAQVVEARAERVLTASALRREPACVHAGRCGGCTLQHLPHVEQLALKQRSLAEQLQRFAGVQPDEWVAALSGPELGYRRRARIAVRWDARGKRLEVGFRAAASQEIVAISDCPVLVEPLQPILRALPALLGSLSAPQALGHVELFHGTCSSLLLRHTALLSETDMQRLRSFCAGYAAQLWLHGAGEPEADQSEPDLGYRLDAF